jgi:hypothetical protein
MTDPKHCPNCQVPMRSVPTIIPYPAHYLCPDCGLIWSASLGQLQLCELPEKHTLRESLTPADPPGGEPA